MAGTQELGAAEPMGKSGLARLGTLLLPLLGLLLVNLLYVCAALIMRRLGSDIPIARFWSLNNLTTVIIQTVMVAIAGLGMTFVIVSGGIDLSVGSVVAFVTVAIALALQPLPGGDHLPVWLAGLLGILVGGLCGFVGGLMLTERRDVRVGLVIVSIILVTVLARFLLPGGLMPVWIAGVLGILAGGLTGLLNGLMITGLRIVPFIATLGMWSIARGVAKVLAGEQKIDARETWLSNLMVKAPRDEWLNLEPSWFKAIPDAIRQPIEQIAFSPGLWIMMVAVVSMWLVLRYTTFGRYTIAIGSNEPTARLCGVRVNQTKILIYTLSGFLIGLAGLLQFSRLTVGDPTVAGGMELDVIAAVVIGGGSLSGGEGSIMGTLIGALTMSLLRNACDFLNWGNYVQEIFIGIFIVLYVAIDQLRRARTAA